MKDERLNRDIDPAELDAKNKEITNTIPHNKVGEGFEVIYAPTFGPKEERELIERMKKIRAKAFDKNGNLHTDPKHAKAVAEYENERHKLARDFSHIPRKLAGMFVNQCRKGMGFDDLYNQGYVAVMKVIDSWPPFLGKEDKGSRLFTAISKAVSNSLCRWLDDFNREIRIPSYMSANLTVRLYADDLLYGKKIKKTNSKCGCKNCPCDKHLTSSCNRRKLNSFEKSVVKMIKDLGEDISIIDGKSLKDFFHETGEYKAVAKAVNRSVSEIVAALHPVSSIDTPTGEDQDETIGSLIPSNEHNNTIDHEKRAIIEEALDCLPIKYRMIAIDHYFCGMSISEIAEKYMSPNRTTGEWEPISKVRAYQLLQKVVIKIRNNKKAMNILTHKVVGKC